MSALECGLRDWAVFTLCLAQRGTRNVLGDGLVRYTLSACHCGVASTVIENLLSGQNSHPLRVVAFNIAEGWARDASETGHRVQAVFGYA
jgi:hypothetical protein